MTELPDGFSFPEEALERQRALVSAQAAHQRRRTLLSRRRPLAAALAFVVLLGVLLVTPAFGVRGRILDAIQGKPAPPEVKDYFAVNNKQRAKLFAFAEKAGAALHDRFSPVLADQARGVLAIESPDGPVFLWAAPTEDGRECWLLQAAQETPGGGIASCDVIGDPKSLRPETLWSENRPNVMIVYARIYGETITRVDALLDHGQRMSLAFARGFALGTIARDEKLTAVVGLNDDGEELARVSFH
jgi:hypothetical protein